MATATEIAQLFLTAEEDDQPTADGLVPISLRVPFSRLAHVDAMASHLSISRNEMVNHILSVGIGEVFSALPESIRAELYEDVADRISNR